MRYNEPNFDVVLISTATAYTKSHKTPKIEELELETSDSLKGTFQTRYFKVNDDFLEVYKKKGKELINSFDLNRFDVFLVCNDVHKLKVCENWLVISDSNTNCFMKNTKTSDLDIWCKLLMGRSQSKRVNIFQIPFFFLRVF